MTCILCVRPTTTAKAVPILLYFLRCGWFTRAVSVEVGCQFCERPLLQQQQCSPCVPFWGSSPQAPAWSGHPGWCAIAQSLTRLVWHGRRSCHVNLQLHCLTQLPQLSPRSHKPGKREHARTGRAAWRRGFPPPKHTRAAQAHFVRHKPCITSQSAQGSTKSQRFGCRCVQLLQALDKALGVPVGGRRKAHTPVHTQLYSAPPRQQRLALL